MYIGVIFKNKKKTEAAVLVSLIILLNMWNVARMWDCTRGTFLCQSFDSRCCCL